MPGMTETAMTEALGRFLDVDVARYQLIATNLANVDTPGYHTRDLDFRAELGRAADSASDSAAESGQLSSFSASAAHQPVGHQVRGLMERPDGNNVSVDRESLLLSEVQLQFGIAEQLLKSQFRNLQMAISEGSSS